MLQYRRWQTEQEMVVAARPGGGRDLERTVATDRVVPLWPGGHIYAPQSLTSQQWAELLTRLRH